MLVDSIREGGDYPLGGVEGWGLSHLSFVCDGFCLEWFFVLCVVEGWAGRGGGGALERVVMVSDGIQLSTLFLLTGESRDRTN